MLLHYLPEHNKMTSFIKWGWDKMFPSTDAVAAAVATRTDAPEWRLQLADAIANKAVDVKYPTCDLRALKKLVTIPKNSASITGIFFSEHDGPGPHRDVTIKASFAPKGEESLVFDNSLVIERVNYQLIANQLIRRRWSPHVASYVASFQCPTPDLMSLGGDMGVIKEVMFTKKPVTKPTGTKVRAVLRDAEEENEANKSYYGTSDVQYDLNKVNFVLTERMKGAQLEKWMTKPHSLTEWKSVLWQILYTLEVFNRIGFRHNDLHLGNAFIEDLSGTDAPDNTMYVTDLDPTDGWSYHVVPTKRNNVRIFDFDRSTLECDAGSYHKDYKPLIDRYMSELSTGCTNTRMATKPLLKKIKHAFTHCNDEGACQARNQKFDAFTVLGLLWAAHPTHYKKMEKIYGDDAGGIFGEKLDAQIPDEVLEFIDKHLNPVTARFNPLTMRWNWPYRMSGVERWGKGGKWKVIGGNMELDDREMSTVMEMLNDTDFFDWKTGDEATFVKDCQDAFVFHLPMRAGSSDVNLEGLSCDDDISPSGSMEVAADADADAYFPDADADAATVIDRDYIIEHDGDEWTITLHPKTSREETHVFSPGVCRLPRKGLAVRVLKDICDVISDSIITDSKMKKAQIVDALEAYLRNLR